MEETSRAALEALNEHNVPAVREYINEGNVLLADRKRLLKIADREGWDCANEYDMDDLP